MTVRSDEAEPPPGSVMLGGFIDAFRPAADADAEREAGPKRLLRLVTVIVEVPEVLRDSSRRLMLGGLLETTKSGDEVLKNSVIGMALASPDARSARFQFASIVFVKE